MKMPVIIAEIGSNFVTLEDGIAAIQEAAESGADAVKFQYFTEEELYGEGNKVPRLKPGWMLPLREHAHLCGIKFGITAFSQEGVDRVSPIVDFYKLASAENNMVFNYPRNIPRIISTGGSDFKEIEKIVEANRLGENDCIMYCVAAYPARREDYDLSNLMILKKQFPYLKIGLSDHTETEELAQNAALFGIDYIEKHFRPSRTQPDSPDYPHSIPSDLFMAMVVGIHSGNFNYSLPDCEASFIRCHKRGIKRIGNQLKIVRPWNPIAGKWSPIDKNISDPTIMEVLKDGEFLTRFNYN